MSGSRAGFLGMKQEKLGICSEEYYEQYARCDRLKNSPVFYMIRRLNGKEGRPYGSRNCEYQEDIAWGRDLYFNRCCCLISLFCSLLRLNVVDSFLVWRPSFFWVSDFSSRKSETRFRLVLIEVSVTEAEMFPFSADKYRDSHPAYWLIKYLLKLVKYVPIHPLIVTHWTTTYCR